MSILNFLFGKKKIIIHPIIGEIISDRIKGNNQTKSYTWLGSITLNNQPEKTTIIMEGHASGPLSAHLSFISQLIENWENKFLPNIEQIIIEKGIDKTEKYSNWKNEFYVGAVVPTNAKKSEFELTFEPLNSENSNFICIEFKNSTIINVQTFE